MKKILKELFYRTNFIPAFSPFTTSSKDKIRPYWGFFLPHQLGGPVSRTKRMMDAFGQFALSPNIIHVNSAWDPIMFESAKRAKKKNLKIVFNQNGHFYPAWYKGNCTEANMAMVECQKSADFVIFQSEFSKQTQLTLTGYIPKNHIVLHNAVPGKIQNLKNPNTLRKNCLLTGVFGPDTKHILEPAIRAFIILSKMKSIDLPRLIIAGKIVSKTMETDWYKDLLPEMNRLENEGVLKLCGEYNPNEFQNVLTDIDFALHLKYKDCCPNAVIEKMMHGIPIIFSQSGGTPELIGLAGIPLSVKDSWEEMVPVSVEDLAQAILNMQDNLSHYKAIALQEAQTKHSWENYLLTYKEVFWKVLNSSGE